MRGFKSFTTAATTLVAGTLAKIPAVLEASTNGLTDLAHIHPAFENAKLGSAHAVLVNAEVPKTPI